MPEYSIYVIKNTVNGKCYVGQTKHYPLKRIYTHINNAIKGRGYFFHRALKAANFEDFYLIKTVHCDKKLASSIEKKFIEQYKSLVPDGYNLVAEENISFKKEGWWHGHKRPEATRRKISEVKKAAFEQLSDNQKEALKEQGRNAHLKYDIKSVARDRWASYSEEEKKKYIEQIKQARKTYIENETPEQKKLRITKISEANKGKKRTLEMIEHQRKVKTGKKLSEETKQKMSLAKLGKSKSEETKQNMSRGQRFKVSFETKARIASIKSCLENGERGVDIAAKFDVTPEYIYAIKNGRSGKSICIE